jgi:hypothetical protein
MHKQKLLMLLINLFGGSAVVGSYILGIRAHPGQTEALWGGVPGGLRPIYTANMLLAAVGYLVLFAILMLYVDPDQAQIGKLPFGTFNLLYLLILIPSALWISQTYAVAQAYTPTRWLAILITLGLVGLGSTGMQIAVTMLRPRLPAWKFGLALAGAFFLFLQTGVLDAIVWPLTYLK